MRTATRSLRAPIAVLMVVLALGALRAAPTLPRATPDAVGMSTERLQLATAILRQYVADRKIAGAVAAVARRGKLVYLEPVGLQSLESRAPMTERSLFRIYSMTKAVTAVAVMMLVEEGKLQLTDPASKFLPEFKNAMVQEGGAATLRKPSREITIQDLLLHTSGLSHRTSELYRRLQVRSRSIDLRQFVVNITKAPLMEDPGTRFRYSEATTVLGRIVEVIAKQELRLVRHDEDPAAAGDGGYRLLGGCRGAAATDDRVSARAGRYDLSVRDRGSAVHRKAGVDGRRRRPGVNGGGLRPLQPDAAQPRGARRRAALESGDRRVNDVNALSPSILKEKGGNVGWGLANVDVVVGEGSRGYLTAIGEYGWDGSVGTFFAVDPSKELVVTLMTQNLPANPEQLRQKFKAAVLQSIVD